MYKTMTTAEWIGMMRTGIVATPTTTLVLSGSAGRGCANPWLLSPEESAVLVLRGRLILDEIDLHVDATSVDLSA